MSRAFSRQPENTYEEPIANVSIEVNGVTYEVPEGERLLSVLNEKGIKIPNLCFHKALTPAAACNLCVVWVKMKDHPPATKLACAMKTKAGLAVVTETPTVQEMRKTAFNRLLQMAPNSQKLIDIGKEFNLISGVVPDGCIRCRLCVRVCREIIGAGALKMIQRGGVHYVVPSGEGHCIGCGTCANICPTRAIRLEDAGGVRTIRIRDDVIGRHPLMRCQMCGAMYATPEFLHHVEEQEHAAAHPTAREHPDLCPSCIKLYARKAQEFTAQRFFRPPSTPYRFSEEER